MICPYMRWLLLQTTAGSLRRIVLRSGKLSGVCPVRGSSTLPVSASGGSLAPRPGKVAVSVHGPLFFATPGMPGRRRRWRFDILGGAVWHPSYGLAGCRVGNDEIRSVFNPTSIDVHER